MLRCWVQVDNLHWASQHLTVLYDVTTVGWLKVKSKQNQFNDLSAEERMIMMTMMITVHFKLFCRSLCVWHWQQYLPLPEVLYPPVPVWHHWQFVFKEYHALVMNKVKVSTVMLHTQFHKRAKFWNWKKKIPKLSCLHHVCPSNASHTWKLQRQKWCLWLWEHFAVTLEGCISQNISGVLKHFFFFFCNARNIS